MQARHAAALLFAGAMLQPVTAQSQLRPDVAGREAAVVSEHPLATAAGADVLRRGGNAIDAAITMAAVLSVVRPHMNGVGGDAFMLIRDARTGRVRALNGSGRAGSRATPELFREHALDRVPSSGILTVTVPGAVRAWADALSEAGTITLAQALAPAIRYADEGFPVSTVLAQDIGAARRRLEADPEMMRTFLPGGNVPAVGSLLRQPELARTLRAIAEHGPDAFYTGESAQRLVAFMKAEDGLLTAPDLEKHTSTWQEPLWSDYHGYKVGVLPPNSQGLSILLQLNMAEPFDLVKMGHNSTDYVHTLVEIKKLAFRERDRHVADPAFSNVPVARLISKEYARELAASLSANTAAGPAAARGDGDTVFLCVIDKDGNAVSMIESLFNSFGSGRMVPGTGIVLHNRGSGFTLEPGHPNIIAPGKRPYHTLTPSMILRPDNSVYMLAGTPGADGQPQTILQVFHNITFFGMTPQQGVEAPRWRSYPNGDLELEPGFPQDVYAALAARGHRVRKLDGRSAELGSAQVILVDANGVKRTGADLRREAYAIAW
jgi:gamma-glutamyltranspeptidase/glutathione hydrolase